MTTYTLHALIRPASSSQPIEESAEVIQYRLLKTAIEHKQWDHIKELSQTDPTLKEMLDTLLVYYTLKYYEKK